MYDPVKLLFPHHETAGFDVYEVRRGVPVRIERQRPGDEAEPAEILGLEVRGDEPIADALGRLTDSFANGAVKDRYFFVKTRSQLDQVLGWLRGTHLGTPEVFGIESDHYFAVVPISGTGNHAVQEYVSGLRMVRTGLERLRALVKRVMIRTGRSRPLYGSFLVLVRRSVVTEDDLRSLRVPSQKSC